MAVKLLLLDDVEDLGRSGDVVSVKPGYARNYLLPKKHGVLAHKGALRMQEKLREARLKKAAEDKKEAEAIAATIGGITLSITVKVDHEGHMYGSVTAGDIQKMLHDQHNIHLEKRAVQLKHHIKTTGVHDISVKLKEGVGATVHLKVLPEEADSLTPVPPEAAE